MRLIDAEELMHELDEQVYMQVDDFSIIANVVRSAPTIEAKPVVHAHWIPIGANKQGRGASFNCSACQKVEPYKRKFCPNCGAPMDKIVETDNEIVETEGKIVNSEEFLAEFERVFGKNAEYFMAAAAMRTTPEVKMPSGLPENPSSVADGDSSSSEELVHRAEVFERMAFKLKEERDAAAAYIKDNDSEPCGACLFRDEDVESEKCWNCTRKNNRFIFSAENARRK